MLHEKKPFLKKINKKTSVKIEEAIRRQFNRDMVEVNEPLTTSPWYLLSSEDLCSNSSTVTLGVFGGKVLKAVS